MNIRSNGYYLFDGAMGTYYYSLTGNTDACEKANLTDSERIISIHREYIQAGADAIKTNTFSANPSAGENYKEIIKAACRNAQAAAQGTRTDIFADIGPAAGYDSDEALELISRAADVFIDEGLKNFLLETFDSLAKAQKAAEYIHKKSPDAVILLSFGIDQDGHTKQGNSAQEIADTLGGCQWISGFGFNCVCGPAHMKSIVRKLRLPKKNLIVMPNAGYPSVINGRVVYNDNPMYFAKSVAQIYDSGAVILGGCCGTTPEHIRCIKENVGVRKTISLPVTQTEIKTPPPAEKNIIKDKLNQGRKIIIAEIDPPFDINFSYMTDQGKQAKLAGADAVSVTDSPLARARASSIMAAAKIKREAHIEAIPHITCRDKNRIGMKSAMLGMYMENIRNVMVVTGDPVPASDRETTGSVYQFNSHELAGYLSALNRDIFSEDKVLISAALNPGVANFDAELKRAKRKIQNGVSYFVTQPVFSENALEIIAGAKKELGVPIVVGIMPVAGYKNAVFLNNEVTGVNIPREIIDRFKDKSRDEAAQISVDYASDLIKAYYPVADGFMIMTQLKRTDLTCRVIKQIKELEKSNQNNI